MNELALCQSIVSLVKERSYSRIFHRVKRIKLELGEFADIDKLTLQFCFEQVSPGTLVEGARLELIDIPGSAVCNSCQKIFLAREPQDDCFHCGMSDTRLLSGKELVIRELEVE